MHQQAWYWPPKPEYSISYIRSGWGLGFFLRWWPSSVMWTGSLIYYGHSKWYHLFKFGVMCCMLSTFHVSSQIVANISEPSLLFLNSFLGLAGRKHYQKITTPIFRLVLQNFAIPGYFSYILFYRYLYPLLSLGWFVIAVCGSISVRELVKS